MSQAERIKRAAQISIGGSEDESKENVKRLFKKSSSVKPLASSVYESNLFYESKLERAAYLLEVENPFNDGSLNELETIELNSLLSELQGVTIPSLEDIIFNVPSFKTAKEKEVYKGLLNDLELFKPINSDNELINESNEKYYNITLKEIKKIRKDIYKNFSTFNDVDDLF